MNNSIVISNKTQESLKKDKNIHLIHRVLGSEKNDNIMDIYPAYYFSVNIIEKITSTTVSTFQEDVIRTKKLSNE